MNMTMKWISKSMNLYEYEYDVHEPYDYEKVHEYDTMTMNHYEQYEQKL